MKRFDFDKAKKIGLGILIEIGKLYDEGVELITFEDVIRNVKYIPGDPRRIKTNVRSLERSGYVKISRQINGIEITNKGRIKLLENSTDKLVDGKWRMLSFDIPEKLRKKRDQFRRSIKRIGYKKVQKSLWACPFIKSNEVELIITELEINQYTAFLLVEKTDIENYLQHKFKSELA
jgi:DNA-binding transcriptional regulator PaaX